MSHRSSRAAETARDLTQARGCFARRVRPSKRRVNCFRTTPRVSSLNGRDPSLSSQLGMTRLVLGRSAANRTRRRQIAQQRYAAGSAARCAGAAAAGLAAAPTNFFSRALRRFAAFLCRIPRFAALSIAEIMERTSPASRCSVPASFLPMLRNRVRTLRLRSVRTVVWRARLPADFVLAMGSGNCERAGSRRPRRLSRCEPVRGDQASVGRSDPLRFAAFFCGAGGGSGGADCALL